MPEIKKTVEIATNIPNPKKWAITSVAPFLAVSGAPLELLDGAPLELLDAAPAKTKKFGRTLLTIK